MRVNDYIDILAQKHHEKIEHLTFEQIKVCLEQALKSGDFVRCTQQEHTPFQIKQGVYYAPYQAKLELESKLQKTEAALKVARECIDENQSRAIYTYTNCGGSTGVQERMINLFKSSKKYLEQIDEILGSDDGRQ